MNNIQPSPFLPLQSNFALSTIQASQFLPFGQLLHFPQNWIVFFIWSTLSPIIHTLKSGFALLRIVWISGDQKRSYCLYHILVINNTFAIFQNSEHPKGHAYIRECVLERVRERVSESVSQWVKEPAITPPPPPHEMEKNINKWLRLLNNNFFTTYCRGHRLCFSPASKWVQVHKEYGVKW